MSSPLATFYGSDRAASAIGTRSDLVFHSSLSIDSTLSTPQKVALSPIGAGIDLGRLPGSVAAYLSIKQAVVSTRKSPAFGSIHHAAIQQKTNIASIPTGTNTLTFTFNHANGASGAGALDPTFFQRIGFENTPATNFAINFAYAQTHNAGNFLDLGYFQPAPLGNAFPPSILLSQYFDPIDGLINFDTTNPGFDVQVVFNNSTGGPVTTVNLVFFGSAYSFDWTQLQVDYLDWYGQVYNVGIFDDRAFSQPFGLGQKIPFPITNENQNSFGSLQFTVLKSNSFFNTQYTYDVILNASLEYQLG